MKEWTYENVQRLKIEYLKGTTIKEIARLLNRSPSAINKAITRFKLRQRHQLKKSTPLSPYINTATTARDMAASNAINHSPAQQKRPRLPRLENWVSFDTIISYLEHIGYRIGILESSNQHYQVNGRLLTRLQMIMAANKSRLENQKLPFKVMEITE